jgi:hypothetical protein
MVNEEEDLPSLTVPSYPSKRYRKEEEKEV